MSYIDRVVSNLPNTVGLMRDADTITVCWSVGAYSRGDIALAMGIEVDMVHRVYGLLCVSIPNEIATSEVAS